MYNNLIELNESYGQHKDLIDSFEVLLLLLGYDIYAHNCSTCVSFYIIKESVPSFSFYAYNDCSYGAFYDFNKSILSNKIFNTEELINFMTKELN